MPRILVIEDDADMRDLLTLHLERSGFEVQGAETLREGLQLAAKIRFDWVVLDSGLPDGDGPDFVRIRPPGSIRAVLFTGNPHVEEIRRRAQSLGVEACFSKPQGLEALLHHLVSSSFPFLKPKKSPRLASPSPRRGHSRVVVVDDDYFYRHIIEEELRGLGFSVTSFAEPSRALGASSEFEKESDVIYIVDLFLEEMSGFELLDLLKERRKERPLRAIAITGAQAPFIEREALEHGASFFLRKPFREGELESVCEILSGRSG